MKAGLQMPGRESCVDCHIEKGTPRGRAEASPDRRQEGLGPSAPSACPPNRFPVRFPPSPPPMPQSKGPKYAGAMACGKCHRGRHAGQPVERVAHEPACARLGRARNREGYGDRPRQGHRRSAEQRRLPEVPLDRRRAAPTWPAFSPDEGVGCEACHGAGSDYMPDAIMRDKRAAMAAGLQKPTRETCVRCHQATAEVRLRCRDEEDRAPHQAAADCASSRATRLRSAWRCGPMAGRSTSPARRPTP